MGVRILEILRYAMQPTYLILIVLNCILDAAATAMLAPRFPEGNPLPALTIAYL